METKKQPMTEGERSFWFSTGIVVIVVVFAAIMFGVFRYAQHNNQSEKSAYPTSFNDDGEASYELQVESKELKCGGKSCVGEIKTVDGHVLTVKVEVNQGDELFNHMTSGRIYDCTINQDNVIKKCKKDEDR